MAVQYLVMCYAANLEFAARVYFRLRCYYNDELWIQVEFEDRMAIVLEYEEKNTLFFTQ